MNAAYDLHGDVDALRRGAPPRRGNGVIHHRPRRRRLRHSQPIATPSATPYACSASAGTPTAVGQVNGERTTSSSSVVGFTTRGAHGAKMAAMVSYTPSSFSARRRRSPPRERRVRVTAVLSIAARTDARSPRSSAWTTDAWHASKSDRLRRTKGRERTRHSWRRQTTAWCSVYCAPVPRRTPGARRVRDRHHAKCLFYWQRPLQVCRQRTGTLMGSALNSCARFET